MLVAVSVPDEYIAAALVSASHASRYWATVTRAGSEWSFAPTEDAGPHGYRFHNPVTDAWQTAVVHVYMTPEAVSCGLGIMAARYPASLAELMAGRGDNITADTLVQCCVFGGLVYG